MKATLSLTINNISDQGITTRDTTATTDTDTNTNTTGLLQSISLLCGPSSYYSLVRCCCCCCCFVQL